MTVLFSKMTEEQKEKALSIGNTIKSIAQGTFGSCIILQKDSLDIEVKWENGQKEWISINAIGPTWMLLNND